MEEKRISSRKVRVGKVVSDKMDKTVVVAIEDRVAHALYKKIVGRTYKLKAHDEENACGVGDIVKVMETRPLSKDKRWRVVEIVEKAKAEGRQFFEGNPQDNYPDALDKYRKLMNEKQWEVGEDEEELFEYAMHPAQYEAYRSGKAKVEFKADVAKRKAEKANAGKPTVPATPAAPAPAPAAALTMPTTPQVMTVDVNGQAYRVTVAFGDTNSATPEVKPTAAPAPTAPETTNAPAGAGKEVLSPLEGKFFLIKNASDTPVKVGDVVKEGDVLCYVEAMKTYNAVRAEFGGTITAICLSSGDAVSEDDVLMTIQ